MAEYLANKKKTLTVGEFKRFFDSHDENVKIYYLGKEPEHGWGIPAIYKRVEKRLFRESNIACIYYDNYIHPFPPKNRYEEDYVFFPTATYAKLKDLLKSIPDDMPLFLSCRRRATDLL